MTRAKKGPGSPQPRASTQISRQNAATNPAQATTPGNASVTYLPLPSLTVALDHLDDIGLCSCWIAPQYRRCRARRWSH